MLSPSPPRPLRPLAFSCLCLALACASPTGVTGPDTDVVNEYRAGAVLFTASARRVVGNAIEVTLTATNETDSQAQASIRGGNCMLRPRVYSKRGGRMLWSHFDLTYACQEPLRAFDLGGGDSESVSQTFTVYLENGDNFITVTIQVGTEQVELAAGSITVN